MQEKLQKHIALQGKIIVCEFINAYVTLIWQPTEHGEVTFLLFILCQTN